MVSMNTFQPNFQALQAASNPANNVAQVKAQADAVKMQADALEASKTTAKKPQHTVKAAGTGMKLDMHA